MYYVCHVYQRYITIIIAFLEFVQFPEHHLSYCGVLQEHVRCFTTLEVLLYLCRCNWPFVRSLPELWCMLSTRTTSAGAVPLAGVARLATLLCELLKTPSIIPYLGKRCLVLQGHLQEASRLRTNFCCGHPDGLEKYYLPILKCLLMTIPHLECDCCCRHPN